MSQETSTNKSPLNSLIFIIIGISLGILLGGFLPILGQELKFIGELFINALLMLVVPLVMTSMLTSITSLGNISRLKGIGIKTIIFYFITTGIAVILGLILVSTFQPGVAKTDTERILLRGGELLTNVEYKIKENQVILLDKKLRKSFDDRYFIELIDQKIRGNISEKTKINGQEIIVDQWENNQGEIITPLRRGSGIKIDLTMAKKIEGKEKSSIKETLEQVITDLLPRNLFQSMVENDVLSLIIFSLIFGAVLTTLEDRQILIDFFSVLNKTILKIVDLILIFAPIGIGALIAGRLGDAGGFQGFSSEFISLWKYSSTVILGLILHGFGILIFIYYFITRRSPFKYLRKTFPALITAFSTASSSATIPITLECAIKNNRIDPKIADFVIPLGATINMDGTALYEAVAAVFIAQIYGIELSFGQLIVIFFTATLAAVGAAGIPEAGLVTMVIVLKAVNLPIEGISLILVIDWFLDRCRTTINVWGDSIGAAVIDQLNDEQ